MSVLQKFKTSISGVLAIGIFSTLIVYSSYRWVIKPIQQQRRREEAEAIADFIFQQEQSQRSQNPQQKH